MQPAAAHALPGTTIIVVPNSDNIDLTISVPLHELDLALPGDRLFAGIPPRGAAPPAQAARLADYFRAHLAILPQGGGTLAGKMTNARIENASDDDVGDFDLLVITLTVPVAKGGKAFPATLIYDAVMHEVRNHIAVVMVQSPGQEPVLAGYIGFDPDLGKVAPFDLPMRP